MVNARLALAVGLTLAALIVFLATIALGGALQARLAPWPGIGIMVLTVAAFALSWKQRSFLLAGLLAAVGVVGVVYGMIVTEFFSDIVFPGSIIGVYIGIGVLGLSVAKGVESARINGHVEH